MGGSHRTGTGKILIYCLPFLQCLYSKGFCCHPKNLILKHQALQRMNQSQLLSKHFHDVVFGGNWTEVNLRDSIAGVSWEEAGEKIGGHNSILALVYHMNYYVKRVIAVLQGGALVGSDNDAFAHPDIKNEEDWQSLLQSIYDDSVLFTSLIAELGEEQLEKTFVAEKYGSYYRNIQGITEHHHYHLGQIVLLKKLIKEKSIKQ